MTAGTVARTIWLHIGIPKTGTTTLQTLLFRNQPQLAASDLLYPRTAIFKGTRSHIGLVHYAVMAGDVPPDKRVIDLPEAEVEKYRRTLMRTMRAELAASPCSQVILSSEHLASDLRRQESTSRLVAGLKELADEVRLVVYLRPQHELYSGLFSTQVKSGRAKPARAPTLPSNPFYNYDLMLKRWENAPGIGRITVRLFRPSLFKNGSLIDDFFDALEMPTPADLTLRRSEYNGSLDASTVEFLRVINDVHGGKPTASEARRALIKSLEHISVRKSSTVPNEILERMDRLFEPSNQEVARRYFPEVAGPLFQPFAASAFSPASVLTVSKAVEIASRLWEIRTEQLDEALRGRKVVVRKTRSATARDKQVSTAA